MCMLEKNYNPKDFEKSIYEKEESSFSDVRVNAPSFCIMMPPPNVTGSLHLGHALTYTLQDILIRFKRMQGFDAFWQPGTDHAGIATQMVVERDLAKEGLTRNDLGRDAFLKRAWSWKEFSGNMIVDQQRRLCIAANWEKSRFTLDDGLSESVKKVFVDLYNDGYIYKDKRLSNWDSHFKTAISDLEVISKPQDGHLWHIQYSVVDSNEYITVATTRPETLLADQAVAVHPQDERYTHLIGKHVYLPLTDRTIPIIADEYCDQEKGSGAVKITPAHDFNDFDVGKRHGLALLNMLTPDCTLNENVPACYQGLSIEAARKKVLEDLGERVIKVEEIQHTVPYGDRSNKVIEPLLTDQWFIDTTQMGKNALSAVEENITQFVPKQWENTYFDWLKNIQPWCISRQLWWGHQIPAWYGPDGTVFVALSEEDAMQKAQEHYGSPTSLIQDPDVLDTWFSSALWPFSTLGWPQQTPDLQKHYPTAVLVTGFDIIFFWVARMMMMGLHFMKNVPFKDVYIHALIRDEKGQKMSKSKGNVIDPLDLIEQFGADALRFTLGSLSTPGRDIKLGASKVELNRNFMTKIWNSARFLQMNACDQDHDFDPQSITHPLCRFLVHELSDCIQKTTQFLEDYRFDLYATHLCQWFWGVFCDQFLEALKPVLNDVACNEAVKTECRQTTHFVFTTFLKLLHPITPMITEHLWNAFCPNRPLLFNEAWPTYAISFPSDHEKIQSVFNFAADLRSLKGLLGLPPHEKLKITLNTSDAAQTLQTFKPLCMTLGRLLDLTVENIEKTPQHVAFASATVEGFICLNTGSDPKDIQQILKQKAEVLKKEIDRLSVKLKNDAYKEAKPDFYAQDLVLHAQKQQEFSIIEKIRNT